MKIENDSQPPSSGLKMIKITTVIKILNAKSPSSLDLNCLFNSIYKVYVEHLYVLRFKVQYD